MSKPTVDDLKRWALRHFREMLRSQRLSEQFQRWADGELGRDYIFNIEMQLNDETANFFENPDNRKKLKAERLANEPEGVAR